VCCTGISAPGVQFGEVSDSGALATGGAVVELVLRGGAVAPGSGSRRVRPLVPHDTSRRASTASTPAVPAVLRRGPGADGRLVAAGG